MKKIWNDPVWSKVISGLILASVAGVGSLILNYQAKPTFISTWGPTSIAVNPTILIAVVLFIFLVGTVVLVVNVFTKYDVFISAPMSFKDEESYKTFRSYCMEIKGLLEKECGFTKVYYAGTNIQSFADFSAHQHAAEDDLKALRNSKRFLLIMPANMNSSAIFEAGFAFRKGIPSMYFCKSVDDLPFLMRKLSDSFLNVKIYEPNGGGLEELSKYITKHKRRVFSIKKT